VDRQTGPKHALKQGWSVLVVLTRPDDRRLLPPNLVRQKLVGLFYLVHRFIENGVHHNILQPGNLALFAWLISHQPAVLFSHNKPATSNQPAVLSLRRNQHQPSAASQLNRLCLWQISFYYFCTQTRNKICMSGFFLWKSAEASGIQNPSLHHKLFIILIFLNTFFVMRVEKMYL
jgi:hypothetical protein